jgi:hypothetical protein
MNIVHKLQPNADKQLSGNMNNPNLASRGRNTAETDCESSVKTQNDLGLASPMKLKALHRSAFQPVPVCPQAPQQLQSAFLKLSNTCVCVKGFESTIRKKRRI